MKPNTVYGYMRVSSKEQDEERQKLAILEFGVHENCIVLDKQSGKDFDRPGYKKLYKRLNPGDTLVIKSIDRLGRNYDEILNQWRQLTKEKRVSVVVLDMPLLNTHQEKNLTDELIADIVLQLLSYVAQTEREFIHQRQAEGIAAAKKRGVKFGRRPLKHPQEYESVKVLWKDGKISARNAAKQLGITHKTFLKWVKSDSDEKSTK